MWLVLGEGRERRNKLKEQIGEDRLKITRIGDFKNRELGWAVEVDTESSSIRVIFRKQSQPIQSTEELSQGGAVGRMRNLPPTRERPEYVSLGAWQRGSRDASF